MNSNFVIRPLCAEDRDGMETFFDRLRGEALVFFEPPDCKDYNRNRIRNYLNGTLKNLAPFVAEDTDTKAIAGLVFLSATNTLIPRLGIAIDEDYRGCGLGTRLLEHVHAYAQEHGAGGILLDVHPANTHAQLLYMKAGYVRLGIGDRGQMLLLKSFPATQ